ncbi:tRNA-wybutosine modification methyltransferase TYW3 [Ignicoccus hospitalis]|uniref:tRNA(Phe) 7-((3-amino-3-carboxypropyl)-4-demethylwyosine(37)-N(4))-methyltransferase n=1 Tax=Ignicoccus hospitalis (strain KIN4/I / DSM 18386 / JCM 14125) TaxID=453591 RepID=A8AB77_IGNH4|nr:hypothetical protein [Ignicoccus hospitalis]ABU82179.1 Protein of unknown function DUF207 [Ignicoccus hospitalis KIN4/I]HIH91136.1 hypothetical protein [Desulfurococcaceae archaeon]
MRWDLMKARALERLRSEAALGMVDGELLELLNLINSHQGLFTTSSCSGRITVACSDISPDDKRSTRIIYKTHRTTSVPAIENALREAKCKHLWAKSSHPLLDLFAKELDLAWDIVDLAKKAGFKYSGVQRSGSYYRVIIRSNENIQFPLNGDDDSKKLAKVVSELNKFLLEGKVRLARLLSLLDEDGLLDDYLENFLI